MHRNSHSTMERVLSTVAKKQKRPLGIPKKERFLPIRKQTEIQLLKPGWDLEMWKYDERLKRKSDKDKREKIESGK